MQENFAMLNHWAALERHMFVIKFLRFWVPRLSHAAILDNCTGIMRNVFWTTTCSWKITVYNLPQCKDFGIFISGFETWYFRDSKEREMKKESLNTPTQSPHFKNWSGLLNQTGGTYSHGGMMVYPRIAVTAWNLVKFLDSMESQSWKIDFRTESCVRTADPRVTMLWIKEVEIAKSIDELVTSRSITGQPKFLGVDMLDAMIASALKTLLGTQSNFRKRVSVEEQRAQNCERFLWIRQIANLSYGYFRATGAYEAIKSLADLFTVSLQYDDVQDFRCKMGIMHY